VWNERRSIASERLARVGTMDIAQQFIEYAELHAGQMAWRLITALAIVGLTWLGARLARAVLRRGFQRDSSSARTKTLLPLLETVVTVLLMCLGIVLGLEQFGLDLTAVIAGAGVLGLAVAFGAQELVRDMISGFFLILDDVVETGDVIETDCVTGVVEGVGLRLTKVRAFDGKLWFVPNGQVKVVANSNRGWMRAVITVGLAYEQEARRGMELMAEIGRQWCAEHPDIVLDEPTVQGLLSLDASSVGARLFFKIKPGEHWEAEREIRQRIKEAFDREGVEIPFDRQVLYLRKEDEAAVAAAAE
jgi:moderate conductance mechanosensitive channel